MHDPVLPAWPPPSSPPTTFLLIKRKIIQITATLQNTTTLNPRVSAGTKYPYSLPTLYSYRVAITQGRPNPKNTFTEFDPVTLPTAESAYFSAVAAAILAKVSGRDVPRATNVIAVIEGLILRTHPNILAYSPTTNVTAPIIPRAAKKQAYPLHICGGGTNEKINFHPMQEMWRKPSIASMS